MEKDIIRITVIVTIHNAEAYLRECLDSVCSQTFSQIEILCMDGGSTDSSPQILQEYQKKDKRLRIINDPNTSYGHKVNTGIRQAKGEYISVLESDDMYEPFMLQRLYQIAERYQPDFVNADYISFFDMNGKRYKKYTSMYQENNYGRLMENSRYPEEMEHILRYWTGLFKRDFLIRKNIRMNESSGASFQDMSFRFLTSILADTSYHLREAVYLYRTDNPGSSIYDAKKAVVIADEYEFLKNNLKERNISDIRIWRHYVQWKYRDFFGNMIRFAKENRQALLERSILEREKDKAVIAEMAGEKRIDFDEIAMRMLYASEEEICDRAEEQYCQIKEREKIFLEILRRTEDRQQLIIFGCGQRGWNVLKFLEPVGDKIACCTDNAKVYWNTEWNGMWVLPPTEAMKKYPEAIYLIASKYYAKEIQEQLLDFGIVRNNIYFL